MATPQAEEVLDFWFGEQKAEKAWLEARGRLWFGGDAQTDAQLRERFLARTEAARAGELDAWGEEPRGLLALVILLDQLSRSLFRGTPEAFRLDPKARALAHRALAEGWAERYTPLERIFLFMPLMHSESLAEQEQCVVLFQELAAQTQGPIAYSVRNSLDYAQRHLDIVARFGRFPHRNDTLGRASTPEEVEFLKQPGSRF